jgi:hypothetical protein
MRDLDHPVFSGTENTDTIQSASTQLPGVIIMYGVPVATSVSFAFLAHVELLKSCVAPESNSMIIGHQLRRTYPQVLPLPWVYPPRWGSWRSQTTALGPSDGPTTSSPWMTKLMVSCLVWVGTRPCQSGQPPHNCSMGTRWE